MKTLASAAVTTVLSSLLLPFTTHAQTSLPEAQVNALESVFGKHAGFRRAQAKGLCASGYFVGNTVGRALSSASVFSGDKVPVVARFSVGGGNPQASDKSRSVRGLALQFSLPQGEQWLTANISAPMYFVSRPEQFLPFFSARVPDPATGKPDPINLKLFSELNPETTLQAAYLARTPVPSSYGAANYWGVNAFEFVNARGKSQFARWQFVPEQGALGLTDAELKARPDHFLADELRQRVAAAPVAFDFKLQLAEIGDVLTDPTKVWPDTRTVVPAGKLVIDRVEPDAGGACDRITFNPLVLPKGIKPSADPVLLARAAPYGVSLGRRLSESAK
ncbi:MAG: catalase family peroxidase [Burkholderiaceae bacterium]|nr:catalase family peroxidase [Burkholderiaceae bacterium]